MKEIKLTQGLFAQVDDSDFDNVNQWQWYALKIKKGYYAVRHDDINHNKIILMHRFILQTPISMKVDHKDHNGLNCQRNNIRNCSTQQNNTNKTSVGKSKYLGVTHHLHGGFVASIRIKGIATYLGYYKDEKDAAIAYDKAAKINHREFANLNFK